MKAEGMASIEDMPRGSDRCPWLSFAAGRALVHNSAPLAPTGGSTPERFRPSKLMSLLPVEHPPRVHQDRLGTYAKWIVATPQGGPRGYRAESIARTMRKNVRNKGGHNGYRNILFGFEGAGQTYGKRVSTFEGSPSAPHGPASANCQDNAHCNRTTGSSQRTSSIVNC